MILFWLYIASIVGLFVAIGIAAILGIRKRAFQPFTTLELATAAILICLLHVAVIPWQIGLARVPGLDALVFSIPYTAMFLLGLRLVPKAGFATLLIFGQGLFGQLLGRGINPAWWPYYLWCALGVEILLLSVGGRVKKLTVMLGASCLSRAPITLHFLPIFWMLPSAFSSMVVRPPAMLPLVGCESDRSLVLWRSMTSW